MGGPGDDNRPVTRRVLVVARWYPSHDNPWRGTFVADQAAALRDAGAEVAVVAWEPVLLSGLDGPDRETRLGLVRRWAEVIADAAPLARPVHWGAPGVPIARLPAPIPAGGDATRDPVDLAPLQAEMLVPFGLALAKRWSFDLIHAHGGLPDGLAAARPSERLDVPLVVTEHDSLLRERMADPRAVAAYRGLFGPGRRVLAVSGALADVLVRGLGVPAASVTIVPNAVPIALFRATAAPDRDPMELLWVGARKASKGTDTLLRAFRLARLERPGLRLRLIGRGPTADEEGRLRALAAELGVADAVAFEPPVDRPAVAAAMARAALFVHPSPWETFGVVAVEALASGLPVVATPSGGVEEIVGHDGTLGEIADAPDEAALGRAIVRALDRRESFDAERLRSHVEERYAAPAVAARLLDLYREVAGEPAAAAAASPPLWPEVPGEAEADDLPLIVGGRRRSAIVRLASMPSSLAGRLTVLTAAATRASADGAANPEPPVPQVGRWLEVDPDAAYRERLRALGGPLPAASGPSRIARALRHPVRWARLRRLRAERGGLAAAAWLAAVRRGVETMADGPAGQADRPVLLPVDIDDLARLEPLIAGGARIAPGSLGWLADRIDEREPAAEVRPEAGVSR
jgi:glycosyltransferase involved in cell wall biosynthesis